MKKVKYINCAKYALFFIAIFFIVIGIMSREYMLVFKKAATICLECIGIA